MFIQKTAKVGRRKPKKSKLLSILKFAEGFQQLNV